MILVGTIEIPLHTNGRRLFQYLKNSIVPTAYEARDACLFVNVHFPLPKENQEAEL